MWTLRDYRNDFRLTLDGGIWASVATHVNLAAQLKAGFFGQPKDGDGSVSGVSCTLESSHQFRPEWTATFVRQPNFILRTVSSDTIPDDRIFETLTEVKHQRERISYFEGSVWIDGLATETRPQQNGRPDDILFNWNVFDVEDRLERHQLAGRLDGALDATTCIPHFSVGILFNSNDQGILITEVEFARHRHGSATGNWHLKSVRSRVATFLDKS